MCSGTQGLTVSESASACREGRLPASRQLCTLRNPGSDLAGRIGLEPISFRLTGDCSTIELTSPMPPRPRHPEDKSRAIKPIGQRWISPPGATTPILAWKKGGVSVSLLSTLSFYHGWNYDNYDFSSSVPSFRSTCRSTSNTCGSAYAMPYAISRTERPSM